MIVPILFLVPLAFVVRQIDFAALGFGVTALIAFCLACLVFAAGLLVYAKICYPARRK